MDFPFEATITQSASTNTLKKGKAVTVISMADEEDCEHSMWVTIQHEDGDFDIPLEQVEPCAPSSKTRESIEDWRYWRSQGNSF